MIFLFIKQLQHTNILIITVTLTCNTCGFRIDLICASLGPKCLILKSAAYSARTDIGVIISFPLERKETAGSRMSLKYG